MADFMIQPTGKLPGDFKLPIIAFPLNPEILIQRTTIGVEPKLLSAAQITLTTPTSMFFQILNFSCIDQQCIDQFIDQFTAKIATFFDTGLFIDAFQIMFEKSCRFTRPASVSPPKRIFPVHRRLELRFPDRRLTREKKTPTISACIKLGNILRLSPPKFC